MMMFNASEADLSLTVSCLSALTARTVTLEMEWVAAEDPVHGMVTPPDFGLFLAYLCRLLSFAAYTLVAIRSVLSPICFPFRLGLVAICLTAFTLSHNSDPVVQSSPCFDDL